MLRKLFLLLAFVPCMAFAQFDNHFENKTLRIDYYHFGTADTEQYALKEMMWEPVWGGSKTHLIDSLNYGTYMVVMMIPDSDIILYSRGYCTLFGEWQSTEEAQQTQKGFEETVLLPYPKEAVDIVFFSRSWEGEWIEKHRLSVDPASYFIAPAKQLGHPVFNAWIGNPDPSETVDIVILPDGYTHNEMEKFRKDCLFFVESLFKYAPYSRYRNSFSIRAVMVPSADSGVSKPGEHIYKNTALDFSFYTFDSERYLMSTNNKAIRDLAGQVPYDQIYVLVNTQKYGGGGIYNFYCSSASGNSFSSDIIIHEFGHGFAGLADEYYDDDTSYENFYNLEVEPWEPNITSLTDFGSKWQTMVGKDTPVPTPRNAGYDDRIGVFEGGGYCPKGMYSPKEDCLMKSFREHMFCEVCEKAIEKMILFYTE